MIWKVPADGKSFLMAWRFLLRPKKWRKDLREISLNSSETEQNTSPLITSHLCIWYVAGQESVQLSHFLCFWRILGTQILCKGIERTYFELAVLERGLRRLTDGTQQIGKQKGWFISIKFITGFLDANVGTVWVWVGLFYVQQNTGGHWGLLRARL